MSWLSKLGKGLLGGVTGFFTGGPIGAAIGGVTGAISGGGSKNPFDPNSPEGMQEGATGGAGGLGRLLTNPLTLGLAGSGLSAAINSGARKDANALNDANIALLRQLTADQGARSAVYNPLMKEAGTTLGSLLKPGSGSMLSPEGATRYTLPEYKPGANFNLPAKRSGFRALGAVHRAPAVGV